MTSFDGHSGNTPLPHVGDPVRWINAAPESLGPAGRLLVFPPPIMALPSDVAMRVRSNVLRVPSPAVSPTEFGSTGRKPPDPGSLFARNVTSMKLGGIAVSAALFGAGAMTALSAIQDPNELRVVIAAVPQGTPAEQELVVDGAHERKVTNAPTLRVTQQDSNSTSFNLEAQSPNAHDLNPIVIGDRQDGTANALPERLDEELSRDRADGVKSRGTLEHATAGNADLTSAQVLEGAPVGRVLVSAARRSDEGGRSTGSNTHELELLAGANTIERPVVRPQFRRVTAAPKKARQATPSSLEEETLLLEEARSKLGRAPDSALALALEHQSRFRQGQLLEQRRMIHLEALLRLGKDDEAKKLVGSIGSSIYQARAAALLVRYGIVE